MTKQEFAKWTEERVLLLDGATGSNLQRRGMPSGVCPEKWISEHPDIFIALQKEYVEAGTQILYAPTFTANRIKLAEYGLEKEIRSLNHRLTALSREAAGDRALVAGDLTMTGEQLSPVGKMDFEELIGIYSEQIGCLAEAGVDLLVVETMMSLQECRAALIAAKETAPKLPVMVTMTFEADGRSLMGTDAATAAVVLESLGADAVGANCSTGPEGMACVIRSMASVTRIPIIAKPNAGLPRLGEDGLTVYDMSPSGFAQGMRLVYEAGASILGGCCGTTPGHIRELASAFAGREAEREQNGSSCMDRAACSRRPEGIRYLTSERRTVAFGLNDPFLVIGERINPTGKKKLQESLRQKDMELVLQFAEEQEAAGASVLDVNMGMSGIDEKEMMLKALEELPGVTQLPLSLDSSHVEVLEAALRRYPGRALINSISMEKEKMERLLPLAKKYGAMFILLPLSDAGLPGSLEEKKTIIHRVLDCAAACGLSREDVIVDGLVTTVGANPAAALETLETIRYCRDMGLATVVGLSNISFGLPERLHVNTAFLTMAVQAGLTMAIANPSQSLLMAAAFASDLLMAKQESDLRYIEYAGAIAGKYTGAGGAGEKGSAAAPAKTGRAAGSAEAGRADDAAAGSAGKGTAGSADGGRNDGKQRSAPVPPPASPSGGKILYEAVLKGRRASIEALTRTALEDGIPAGVILNEFLLPAIDQVGRLFDTGRYFLPQLIASAEAMKQSISILEPCLAQDQGQKKLPVVVTATVQGDIHDIGKNLVVLMLKNHGFQVIDLGKDVPGETIVQAAAEHHAALIGLSALMTTTMKQMKHVVELVHSRGLTAKIMVGGAVVTQDYADEIGADGYARDAADTVRLAKRLLGLE